MKRATQHIENSEAGTWYVAELVEEFTIEGERDNVVHCDMILIQAGSAEAAYDEAILFGGGDDSYKNPEGKTVTARFKGLRSLERMAREPAHGALVSWQKRTGMSELEIQEWIRAKQELGAFHPEGEIIDRPPRVGNEGGSRTNKV